MFGLITLSLTLLLKPLGSVIFGHIGDKYGRKVALIYSLIAISMATTCIGLIPGYTIIGWLSSALLILCLFIQGICMGGQYTGAIIFIQEHTLRKKAAFSCGLMVGIGVLGTLMGTTMSYLFYNLEGLSWAWRLPFFLTSIMGIFLYYLMKNMEETPAFLENKNQQQKEKIPFIDILKNHKITLCSAIFISSIPVSMFYLAAVYLPNFFDTHNSIHEPSFSLRLVCLAQVICMIFIPIFGYIADKIGKEIQLKITSILLIITPVFLFYFIGHSNSPYALITGVIVLSIFSSLYSGPAPALLSESFPVIGRYSGMGISIALGEGIFGGLASIICVEIEKMLHSKIAPAYFIMFLGVLSFVGLLLLRKKDIPHLQENKMHYLAANHST